MILQLNKTFFVLHLISKYVSQLSQKIFPFQERLPSHFGTPFLYFFLIQMTESDRILYYEEAMKAGLNSRLQAR